MVFELCGMRGFTVMGVDWEAQGEVTGPLIPHLAGADPFFMFYILASISVFG